MPMSIQRSIRSVVVALAASATPMAGAYASGLADVVACALKQPIQLQVQEIGTQLGLVIPAQVLSPPGAPPAIPGAGRSSVMVGKLMVGDREVGVMTGTCTTVGNAQIAPDEPAGDIDVCNQTFNFLNLPAPYEQLKGRIVVNGPVNRTTFHGSPTVAGDGTTQIMPVIGGTGSFRAVRGHLKVRESDFAEHIQIWDFSALMCL